MCMVGFDKIGPEDKLSRLMYEAIHMPDIIEDISPIISSMDLFWLPFSLADAYFLFIYIDKVS